MNKVLFICRANAGRSQSAMTFYNAKYPGMAESAGTQVDIPGQKLADRRRADIVVAVMAEKGFDMSQYVRRQLTPEMLDNYSQIICLAQPEAIPEYLRNYPGVDDTLDQPIETVRRICGEIELLVGSLGR
jgi:protein-tyrosine-phosphatase